MEHCPRCNLLNRSKAKFCAHCGTALSVADPPHRQVQAAPKQQGKPTGIDKNEIWSEIERHLSDIIRINAQPEHWAKTSTGIFGEAVAEHDDTPDSGILIVWENSGSVLAISTTNNSFWQGEFANGIIRVDYVNQYAVTGKLELELSTNGIHLTGHWQALSETGTYRAFRTRNFTKTDVMAKLESIANEE